MTGKGQRAQVLTWEIPVRYKEKSFTLRVMRLKCRVEVSSPEMWETIHPWTYSEFEQNPEQPHVIQFVLNRALE